MQIYLVQQPMINNTAPIRNVVAVDIQVYMRMEVKNIGTAVMPKHKVQRLTCINGTE